MISFKRKNQGCGQLGILRSLGSVVFVVILCFWIVVTVTAPGVDQRYIFKGSISHCYVRLPECIIIFRFEPLLSISTFHGKAKTWDAILVHCPAGTGGYTFKRREVC